MKAFNEIIEDANNRLQKTLSSKKLDRNLVQEAQCKLDIGNENKNLNQHYQNSKSSKLSYKYEQG